MACEQAHNVAEGVARSSYGKLIAYLAARNGDVAAAEDSLADAFSEALARWPVTGCPENPEAWLLTVARRKSIDRARRRQYEDTTDQDLEQTPVALGEDVELPGQIPDRRLALPFTCAHPALEPAVRAPLMLQAVMGLDAARIATAFLVSPAAMSKRLVRAKAKIREAGIPFRVPEREELPQRLDAVLEAIYAAYSEGWTDAAGTDAFRRELSEEAIFLARLVTELLPEPEALGLCALLLYAEARRAARRDAAGRFVPFERQEIARWDKAMIEEAEALLRRAGATARMGRYQLEAALQSAHIARRRAGWNNWADVLRIYDALLAVTESPVVAVNRALAVAEVEGAQAGLRALPDAKSDVRLTAYQPFWAVRAELEARAGDMSEARHAYEVAIGLERDPAIQEFLREKRARLGE